MNSGAVSLRRHATMGARWGMFGGIVLLLGITGCQEIDDPPAIGDDVDVVQRKSMLSEDAETAKAAGWKTETVHYDFVENGELKGGVLEIPSAPPALDAAFLAAAPLWNVVTLRDNGDPDNRIDLVVVGDGYTSADIATYTTHTDNVITDFFSDEPLSDYATLFNVHRVDVISNESGVDNDPTQGISRDTALDMQYWCGGTERLLCVDVSKAIAAASEAPDVDQILAIANSTKYGGAGYSGSDLGTLAGGSGSAVELALHEFGHSFADLADEYDYEGPETWTGGEPSQINVSIYAAAEMTARATKWFRWLDEPNVDTFEGANYSRFGIYRPTDNSKMRALGRPFEQVNAEQFIVMMYATIDPIDDASPSTGAYTEDDTLFVTPVPLSRHAMDVQWRLDGVDIPGATGTTLALSSLNASQGTHTVSAVVVDNTDLVRDETIRAARMTATREWTVTINSTSTCNDGVQNGNETDEDCGGSCPKCADGRSCLVNADCQSDNCSDGTCEPVIGNGVLIPAHIEAEDYVRYFDTTAGNTGGGCDTGDDVDKEITGDSAGGGCNVGWVDSGEWLEYDVTVAETRTFDITLRLASSSSGKTCRVEIDGIDVSGAVQAPANGWQSYEDRVVSNVTIGAGDHVVRVYMITNYLNINYIDFTLTGNEPICGNGTCDTSEDCNSCPTDCGACPTCDDGIRNQGEEGVDCGGPCPAACQQSGCTCPSGCDAVVGASVPFDKDGSDDTCYFISGNAGSYINNWNNSEVNLNGTDITNIWIGANNYPAQVDGGYYLYVRGSYPWSHTEVRN